MRKSLPGTGSAKLTFVQVQLTEFSSDSYPLPIELRSEVGIEKARASSPLTGRTSLNRDGLEDASNPSTIESFVSHKKQVLQFHGAKAGSIGTSCLSIIGMIRPGRTVRLYRQIH